MTPLWRAIRGPLLELIEAGDPLTGGCERLQETISHNGQRKTIGEWAPLAVKEFVSYAMSYEQGYCLTEEQVKIEACASLPGTRVVFYEGGRVYTLPQGGPLCFSVNEYGMWRKEDSPLITSLVERISVPCGKCAPDYREEVVLAECQHSSEEEDLAKQGHVLPESHGGVAQVLLEDQLCPGCKELLSNHRIMFDVVSGKHWHASCFAARPAPGREDTMCGWKGCGLMVLGGSAFAERSTGRYHAACYDMDFAVRCAMRGKASKQRLAASYASCELCGSMVEREHYWGAREGITPDRRAHATCLKAFAREHLANWHVLNEDEQLAVREMIDAWPSS